MLTVLAGKLTSLGLIAFFIFLIALLIYEIEHNHVIKAVRESHTTTSRLCIFNTLMRIFYIICYFLTLPISLVTYAAYEAKVSMPYTVLNFIAILIYLPLAMGMIFLSRKFEKLGRYKLSTAVICIPLINIIFSIYCLRHL